MTTGQIFNVTGRVGFESNGDWGGWIPGSSGDRGNFNVTGQVWVESNGDWASWIPVSNGDQANRNVTGQVGFESNGDWANLEWNGVMVVRYFIWNPVLLTISFYKFWYHPSHVSKVCVICMKVFCQISRFPNCPTDYNSNQKVDKNDDVNAKYLTSLNTQALFFFKYFTNDWMISLNAKGWYNQFCFCHPIAALDCFKR